MGLQQARLPFILPNPRPYSNSCPLHQWCHPTISSSVAPSSSFPQSFFESGSFPMSQLFTTGGQSIGASVLVMNIQGWFPLGSMGLISLLSKGLSRVFAPMTCYNFPLTMFWGGNFYRHFTGKDAEAHSTSRILVSVQTLLGARCQCRYIRFLSEKWKNRRKTNACEEV